MSTKEAAKKYGVTPATLIRNAKAAGVLPKQTLQTGKRGRPGLLWTERQAAVAAGA